MEFLSKHVDGIFYGALSAVSGVAGWLVFYMVGKPILALRDTRLKALRVAERYAYFGSTSTQSEERVREVRRELFDVAAELTTQTRGHSWPVRCYFGLLRHNFEAAASALRGLGQMAGEDYSEQVRTNNLNHVYISLRAHHHLTPETVRKHREVVEAAGEKVSGVEGEQQ
jgi:hypothetical protein